MGIGRNQWLAVDSDTHTAVVSDIECSFADKASVVVLALRTDYNRRAAEAADSSTVGVDRGLRRTVAVD